MTKQQLQSDIDGEDFDQEEDRAQLEHYQLNGNKPRLMPDLRKLYQPFNELESMYG